MNIQKMKFIYVKAKRFVGLLNLGRPGGGAPMISPTGQRLIRTKEDPLLRFQWTNELRKCVDNTLRYKTTKDEQDDYRGHLGIQITSKHIIFVYVKCFNSFVC